MDSDRQAAPTRQLDSETLERLHEATTRLRGTDGVEECVRQTAAAAIDVLELDWCGAVAADGNRETFEVVVTEGTTASGVDDVPFALDQDIVERVYQAGEPEIVSRSSEHPDGEPSDDRIESALVVPVGSWGVFQAVVTGEETFDGTDRRLLELLVSPLATTVEREAALREQREKLEYRNDQIEAIHAVSTAMKLADEADDVYGAFVETVEEVLDIGICTLDEYDGCVLKTRAVGSEMELEDFYTETPLDQSDSLAAETFERGETIVVDDLGETAYRTASAEYRSVISVPLGEWGIFQAATPERDAFGQTDRRLLELLADAAEAALERVERQQELAHRARQLEQRNQQLDQFASRLSHEMRNPLSVLEARTTLARETGEPEHFEHMERSIRRMKRLIDDTLALAREGVVDVTARPVALDDLARESWEGIRTPNTELRIETGQYVLAGEDRLHQLLSNLFRNAVEHTPAGVTVTVGDLSDGFYVEDDGPGIPLADREAVLTTGTSGLAHGTGLGLAVVRHVAESHGWSLRLTESDDGGARFEFRDVSVPE